MGKFLRKSWGEEAWGIYSEKAAGKKLGEFIQRRLRGIGLGKFSEKAAGNKVGEFFREGCGE